MKKTILGFFLFSIFFLSVSADLIDIECSSKDNECLKKCYSKSSRNMGCEFECCDRTSSFSRDSIKIKDTSPAFTQAQYVSMVGGGLFLVFLGVLFYRRKKISQKNLKSDK